MAERILVAVFLLFNSMRDIRERRIWLYPTLFMLAAGLIRAAAFGEAGSAEILADGCPGLLFLSVSVMTRGTAGFGDGLVILACGIWSGAAAAWGMLLSALLLVFAILPLSVPEGAKAEVPFVPFLLAGYLLWNVLL